MTADLLADYPDVFAGGSVDSGLPAQCATTQAAASQCQYGSMNLTPAQWGDKVRASNPGYSGPWPRVAIWQGASDYTVYPVNATELRDQWTNVWGIGQTASSTQSLPGGTTLSVYNDSAGKPAVELYQISGMAHGLAVDPGSATEQCGATGAYYIKTICSSYYTARFWGLDGSHPGDGGGTVTLPAPAGLKVTGTTDTTAALSWTAVSGAASYNVYRNGAKTGSPTAAAYTDTGLTAGTAYTYTVTAVDSMRQGGTRLRGGDRHDHHAAAAPGAAREAAPAAVPGAAREAPAVPAAAGSASRPATTPRSRRAAPTRAAVTPTPTAPTRTWACGTCSSPTPSRRRAPTTT